MRCHKPRQGFAGAPFPDAQKMFQWRVSFCWQRQTIITCKGTGTWDLRTSYCSRFRIGNLVATDDADTLQRQHFAGLPPFIIGWKAGKASTFALQPMQRIWLVICSCNELKILKWFQMHPKCQRFGRKREPSTSTSGDPFEFGFPPVLAVRRQVLVFHGFRVRSFHFQVRNQKSSIDWAAFCNDFGRLVLNCRSAALLHWNSSLHFGCDRIWNNNSSMSI